jgi:hypothetical protein
MSYPRLATMNTIQTTLLPAADGTLHLPVPAAWRHLSIRVKAEMEPVAPADAPTDKRSRALVALQRIAAHGGMAGIADASAWQREQCADRALPGRESYGCSTETEDRGSVSLLK